MFTRLVGDFLLIPNHCGVVASTRSTFQVDKGLDSILLEKSAVTSGSRFARGSTSLVENKRWLTLSAVRPKWVGQALNLIQGNFSKHTCIPMRNIADNKIAFSAWNTTLQGLTHWATFGLAPDVARAKVKALVQNATTFRTATQSNF